MAFASFFKKKRFLRLFFFSKKNVLSIRFS